MSITCIEQLAPILTQAEQHSEHGGVMANDQIAAFYETSEQSIRTLKKRLSDEQAIEENRHWIKGQNNKTLWTIRGFIRLGMRLSSGPALAFQSDLEDLLGQLNTGQLQIVPVDGAAVGVQLVTVEAQTDIAPLPLAQDEESLGRALGAAKFRHEQQKQSETVQRISDIAQAHYQELKQGADPEGKLLAHALGLPMETVTNIMQGAA